jgi:TRAP transporter TAXI family solute receptor
MKNLTRTIVVAGAFALTGTAASADTFVRMITGPAGGSWYPYGAKMMELMGKQIAGISTSSGPGGGVGNVRNVDKGKAELGWTFGNTAYDGYNGRSKFKKATTNVRFFAHLYPAPLQVAVPAKSNIRSFTDLKDKRLSPGKLTFSGNIAFEKLLGLYGITYAQVKRNGGTIHRVGYKDSVALMKDGHIDAFVGMTTAPNASYIALDFSPGIRFLEVSDRIADRYVKDNPGFTKAVVRKGTYKNLDRDVRMIAAPTVLIINKNVTNDLAYRMAKVLWDSHPDLVKVNAYWKIVNLADAVSSAAIPVHPGAAKYYKEKGVAN